MIRNIISSQLDKEYLAENLDRKASKPEQQVDFANFVVNKPWGCEYLVFSNSQVEIWHLFIKKLASTSVHCHPTKKTSLILLEGEAIFSTLNESFKLNPLDAMVMEAAAFHSTQAISEGGIHLLEIETPPDKYDLVRLQDKYGRIKRGYEGREAMFPDRENSLRFQGCELGDFFEKDFYNKRISIQNVMAENGVVGQYVGNADLAIILDNQFLSSSENFLIGDVMGSDEFHNKFKIYPSTQKVTAMFIKTAL